MTDHFQELNAAVMRNEVAAVALILETKPLELNSIKYAASLAARKGHVGSLKLLIRPEHANELLPVAAQYNQYEAVLLLLFHADEYDIAKWHAQVNLNARIFELLKNAQAMLEAASNGDYDKVVHLLDTGVTNYNAAMKFAAYNGHAKIVQLMLQKGANNYDSVMATAGAHGYTVIANMMILAGAKDFNRALMVASLMGQLAMAKLFIESGATDITGALENAAYSGNKDLVKYLLSAGANVHKLEENRHTLLNIIELLGSDRAKL